MYEIPHTSDGRFAKGVGDVSHIRATLDGTVEFVTMTTQTLAHVGSRVGFGAYYPLAATPEPAPIEAVLMDLDGTTVRSEARWIELLRLTMGSLVGDPGFMFDAEDLPQLSGHSVAEHLAYAVGRYLEPTRLTDAIYEYEQRLQAHTRINPSQCKPMPGLRSFLLALKERGIPVGLVTSGWSAKAWPQIDHVFREMEMGDPREFYDAIVTGGNPCGHGRDGTLCELPGKPHPWLYAEAAIIGLGVPLERRQHVVGIEDSAAGVCALRIAGYRPIGIAGGNIIEAGALELCEHYVDTLSEILAFV